VIWKRFAGPEPYEFVPNTYLPMHVPAEERALVHPKKMYGFADLIAVHMYVTLLPNGTFVEFEDTPYWSHICGCCAPPAGVYAKHAAHPYAAFDGTT